MLLTLFSYLFRSWKPPQDLSIEVLIDILHMCKMWYIEDGFKFAKHWLEQCKIPATQRLKLATHSGYEIQDWVTPAVQELLRTPLSSLSFGDLDHINIRLYSIIAKAKEAIEKQR
jgi:hypothetical protein